ncbi:hypothetical protein L1N85_19865 [Paenibacillus alkaliterrae]|uniref:hypothetical protein n=1 Tax=Paenibacillus alkaliterrae TaxID=320909 RepID=UPI001F27EE66|nr:hypothetical protein [Paenibacillus alkaliterrae]MCF2940652.1 hypothetical protein [Paenibacillus alkaliterrae]
MESFIGTIVFILPGFIMYFWIQTFGINSVIKHTPLEMGTISALLWLPVSASTLGLYNLFGTLGSQTAIWTLEGLKEKSSSIIFLTIFIVLSIFVSFPLSFFYVKLIFPYQRNLINKIRSNRGVASYSDMPSVWDEVFGKDEVQIVSISKIDKQTECIIGEIQKAPRPFEPEKAFYLRHVELFTKLVTDHKIPVTNVFVDTKSGSCIKIYDKTALSIAMKKDNAPEE